MGYTKLLEQENMAIFRTISFNINDSDDDLMINCERLGLQSKASSMALCPNVLFYSLLSYYVFKREPLAKAHLMHEDGIGL